MIPPVYTGLTCRPKSLYDSGGCTQGGYPIYTANVSMTAQLQIAVNFARNTGVRSVIKNTGHEFSGKSGGAGSLSVWVYNLKDIAYIPSYNNATTDYDGPAIKARAGVQVREIYSAARDHGLVTIGGEGQRVGAMGGYVQGGGHSPLSPLHGMAAVQELNYEVVTADGDFVTANAKETSDLFWALRGGGDSTYGVVTSAVIKAHPYIKVTSTTFSYSTKSASHESFWAGFRAYLNYFPAKYAIKASADAGLTTIAFNQAPKWTAGGKQDTAVNPAWRETLRHIISSVNWPIYASTEEQMAVRQDFTFKHMQRWRDASPGAGSYLSESDRLEPNFQWSFYGSHDPKLLVLKKKFDPKNFVFWALRRMVPLDSNAQGAIVELTNRISLLPQL
ncbi:hypothetical protein MBLNU13_g06654t1 [Cladosporium sp. NU13]